jgi:RimJ/RimL family protein N-acetyltransferase
MLARFITTDDMPALRSLRLHALQVEPESFSSTYGSEAAHSPEHWIEKWVAKNPTAAVFDDANLVAMTRLYVSADTPDTAELSGDFIVPSHRGRGLYAALLRLCVQKFLQNPALQFLLRGFLPSNNVSRAVSARYGLKDIGTTNAPLPDGTMATFALTGLNRAGVTALAETLRVPNDVKMVMPC